ncbi:VirB3 family type IV secretion system protein [Neisseria dentiae]|uniref:VirB3 family type IV secretion system protein n=1 Tax=Neisseria dentiae TaxID=194197 RepID=UPI00211C2ABC|nr:VirB3 family type IV secretion system protein [Neisseria dentiae]MCQ9326899.1 VirB3 family type IV secretion system protein [Neisseria dentiae]
MNEKFLEIDDELPGFNALARAATIAGMPLVPALMSFIFPVFISMILLPFIHGKAFLALLFVIPCLLFIYTQTQQDDQALRIIGLSTLSVLRRRNYRLFGKTNTILGSKYGRENDDYQRFFEQNTEKTTWAGR